MLNVDDARQFVWIVLIVNGIKLNLYKNMIEFYQVLIS